jgi:hypothetical protein
VLQWLGVCAFRDDHEQILAAIPEHCAQSVAILARSCAETWTLLGDELDRRRAGEV